MRARNLLVSLALCVRALPAGADVPLPGTQPEDFADPALRYAELLPPSDCALCHSDYDDVQVIEPWDTFMGTPMGAAALDPLFLSALSIAEVDLPGVGDLCLRCHTPEAWLQGRSEPTDGSALLPGDEGITCNFCHRLVDVDPTGRDANAPYIGNAQFFLSPDDTRLGPYDDAETALHDGLR